MHGKAGIYGRTIRVLPLKGDREAIIRQAETEVMAVIGLPAKDWLRPNDLVRRGIPVLFPLGPLDGDEDASVIRSFMPSRADVFEALSHEIAKHGPSAVVILHDPETGDAPRTPERYHAADLEWAEHGTFCSRYREVGHWSASLSDLVLLGTAVPRPRSLPLETRVWMSALHLPMAETTFAGNSVMLMLDGPAFLGHAVTAKAGVIATHADMAATALVEALKVAGRAVTRASLVRALDDAPLFELGLDYTAAQLTGTQEVEVMLLDKR